MDVKNYLSLFISSIVFCSSLQVQAAAPALDQEAPVADPIPFTLALGGVYSQVLYQSVTVGLTGRLSELRLPIGCASGQVIVEIFNANSDGLPVAGESPRLTRRFRADMFPEIVTTDYYPLPLGGRVGVTAGERVVIVLSNPTGSCGIAAGEVGDSYLGGTGHAEDTINGFPVPMSLSGFDDMPFQTLVRRTGPPAP